MNLLDLPYALFAEVVICFSATDAIRCRRICTRAHQAFTRQDLSITLILAHFPRSLEGRLLRQHVRQGRTDLVESRDWAAVFARLTRRYFHLGNAMVWRTRKLETLKDHAHLRGVTPWNRFLRLDNKTAPFHDWDPVWTCDPSAGLVVFPAPDGLGYQAYDLETLEQVEVPFALDGKVVRRVRIGEGVLVFEWCEEHAYHALNERERAHRHFATAFDVRRTGDWDGVLPPKKTAQPLSLWTVKFRSEWKIHYLGLPLSAQDRFFSAHNATHYAVYIWQPTRSPWGEDDPLERLIIWELGRPSSYRPSLDPGEKHRPAGKLGGPKVIRRLTNHELSAWGIRQCDTPSLRGLFLDERTWDEHTQSACGHVFFHEEEHRWSAGPHSSPDLPRLHRVKSTGVPLQGEGPRWADECGGDAEADGDGSMKFCWRGPLRPRETGGGGRGGWSGCAPCWRHDDFPYLTVSEVFDAAAGVRVSARHCFMLETLSVHVRPKLRVQGVGWAGAGMRIEGPDGDEVQFPDQWWNELLGKGFICGNERWIVGEDKEGDISVVQF